MEPTFYVPSTPTYNYPHTRTEAIEYFISSSFNIKQISNLCGILYPQFTRNVVSEIASAKSIGFDLALLAFLPSIAAAERGKHIVTLSNELKNNLSCIFLVGAESGSGKGRALEESLSFFSNWEDDMIKRIRDINKRRSDENEII